MANFKPLQERWYVKAAGGTLGPLEWGELLKLVREGAVKHTDGVWFPGAEDWANAEQIEGLFHPPEDKIEKAEEVAGGAKNGSQTFPVENRNGRNLSKNYIVRHWRGEFSLGVSYWINSLLANLISIAFAAALAASISSSRNPYAVLFYLLAVWAGVIAVWVWQTVGTWRSADRAAQVPHPSIWPGIAKLFLALGTLSTLGTLFNKALPQISEALEFVNGDPQWGERGVRVIRDGTEIEIVGMFASGLEREFKGKLDQNSAVRVVHLNSRGGRLAVAETIRDEIRRRGLDTYVAYECSSACTIAFLGGKHRWTSANAKLGFHLGSFGGEDQGEPFREAYSSLPKAFVDHALSTPSAQVWYPTIAELLAAGVATAKAPENYFAYTIGTLHPTPIDVENELLKAPIFNAFRTVAPESWKVVLAAWDKAALDGFPLSEALTVTQREVGNVLLKRRSIASDEATLALGKVLIDEYGTVQAKNPEACWSYAIQGGSVAQYISPDEEMAELAAETRMLSESPKPPVSEEEGARVMAETIDALQADGQKLQQVANALGPNAPHSGVCPATVAIYRAAMSLPLPDSAQALRYLMQAK